MKLGFVISVIIAGLLAETSMAETVIQCVNGKSAADPDAYAKQIALGWKDSAQFSGQAVTNDADIRNQANTFFATGKYLPSESMIIFNSQFVKYYPYGPGMYCVVKSGSRQP